MMILYQDKKQFLLLPTFGIIFDDGGVWFTVAFAFYGVLFRVYRFPGD